MSEITLLSFTAASVAIAHTLLGPDHYVPFVAMAKARGWSMLKTLRMTLYCGLGHIVGSVMLGVVGVMIGAQLTSLGWIESVRADMAAWALLALGLVYFAWGLRHAYKYRDDIEHGVTHGHHHLKVLDAKVVDNMPNFATQEFEKLDDSQTGNAHTPQAQLTHAQTMRTRPSSLYWAMFIVFVLGPCEALIPLLMYPAAVGNVGGAVIVSSVFAIATVLTMLSAVAVSLWGLSFIKMPKFERFSHAQAAQS